MRQRWPLTVTALAAGALGLVVVPGLLGSASSGPTPMPAAHQSAVQVSTVQVAQRMATATVAPPPIPLSTVALVTAKTSPGKSAGAQQAVSPAGLMQKGSVLKVKGVPVSVYAFTGTGLYSPAVKGVVPRVYVPNGKDNSVSVIDPATYKVLYTFKVDHEPQHVVPSHDLKTLWVASDKGRQSLTPINPRTGRPGKAIPVADPYNLYFTTDGLHAIVVAENQRRLDFREPQTMKLQYSLNVPCRGINHMDFAPDGQSVLAACEFSGDLLKIDLAARRVTGALHVGGMPQDVKISPDGRVYYVADMMANGVYLIDASGETPRKLGFLPTGKGTHGLYPSRDASRLYISNRGEGTVSVLDFASRHLVARWKIPGNGSPDMGSVSPDGRQLWLSGRYNDEVYVFDTHSGALLRRIPVGRGPHGLTYFPQPGRYSLGHTDNYR